MSSPITTLPAHAEQDPELGTLDVALLRRHVEIVLRERWLGALGVALLIAGLVGYTLLKQPPVYAARSVLLIERTADRVVDIKQVVDNSVDGSFTDTLLFTHIGQIQSQTFLQRVVASLTPEERRQIAAPHVKNTSGPEALLKATEPAALKKLLEKILKVERVNRTLLIALTVTHRDPAVAQMLANRIAEQYILHLVDRSSSSNTAAIAFLRDQADELRQKVEKSERDLQDYRVRYNLVSLEENQNIVVERLKVLNVAATQARVARLAVETWLDQVETVLKTGGDVLGLASMPEFAGYAAVQKQIEDLSAQRAVLGERYGAHHPQMIDNARSIEALEKLREQKLSTAVGDLRNQRDKAVESEHQLTAELATAEKESLRLDQLAVGYDSLRREVETTRQTYSQIFARQNETGISSQLQNINIKILDRADLPSEPVGMTTPKITAVCVFLFCIIFFGYALVADFFDNRIKAWWDVEQYVGAPLLSEIGSIPKITDAERGWIVARELDEHAVECFRGLHSQLQLSSKFELPKTLIVTSTMQGEGKTFVASNLAASFAAHGKNTLLVDGDFRRPSLHRLYELDNKVGTLLWMKQKGTTATLFDDSTLGIVAVAPKLNILRTGGVSRKVSEMLESRGMIDLFEALQRAYDVVIIDTPPAGVCPDAEAFAPIADELIYVCRFAGPSRTVVSQVINRLRKTDLSFAGVVLNGLPASAAGAMYYSGYSYYGSRYYAVKT